MNDLPGPASDAGNQISANNPIGQSKISEHPITGVSAASKEIEGAEIAIEEKPMQDATGVEIELPKEVVSAGVKVQPTSIPVPQPISQSGVTASGANITAVQTGPVPLTDDQIAHGLQQSITSSWRWLAEWCVKKLKQFQSGLKSIARH